MELKILSALGYENAGISAKTVNHRSEFERLKSDIKAKKINTIVALKLNRITRSIKVALYLFNSINNKIS